MSGLSINATPTSSTGRDMAGAASGGRPDGKPASGFEALLTAAPAPAGPDNASAAVDTATKRQDSGTDAESRPEMQEAATQTSSTVEKPAPEPVDDNRDAPWPPLGLSGLIPVPLEPAPPPVTPATPPAAPTATAMSAPATGPLALPGQAPLAAAPAAPAVSEAATESVAEQIAQPVDTGTLQVEDGTEPPAPPAFQQVLQNMASAEARATAAPAATAPSATPDMHSQDFDDVLGARIGWLADQKIGHAHIRVTPHDMGQIEVKLQLDGDRLHASFSSANAEVRQALESSLPRLREMLGEQGLQLAQADVGQQQHLPQRDAAEIDAGGSGDVRDGASDDTLPAMSGHSLRLRGLLDAYA